MTGGYNEGPGLLKTLKFWCDDGTKRAQLSTASRKSLKGIQASNTELSGLKSWVIWDAMRWYT